MSKVQGPLGEPHEPLKTDAAQDKGIEESLQQSPKPAASPQKILDKLEKGSYELCHEAGPFFSGVPLITNVVLPSIGLVLPKIFDLSRWVSKHISARLGGNAAKIEGVFSREDPSDGDTEPVRLQGTGETIAQIDDVHDRDEDLACQIGRDGRFGKDVKDKVGAEQAHAVKTKSRAVESAHKRAEGLLQSLLGKLGEVANETNDTFLLSRFKLEENPDDIVGFFSHNSELKEWLPLAERYAECLRCIEWDTSCEFEYIASGDTRKRVEDKGWSAVHQAQTVNHYEQTLLDADGDELATTVRCGAIFHEGEGLTSLAELRAIEEEGVGSKTAMEACGGLDAFKDKLENPTRLGKIVARAMGKKPGISKGQEEAVKGTKEMLSDPEKVQRAIEQREVVLEQKMLFLIQSHIEGNKEKLVNEEPFSFMQLSLLNPDKQEIEESGFAHFERQEIEDMREAFALFKGREVVFDETEVAFIDAEGGVHLPKGCGKEGVESIRLDPLFLNVSVQGHKKSGVDWQEKSNEQMYQLLKKIAGKGHRDDAIKARKLLRECRRALKAGKSSYQVAEDLAMVAHYLKIPLGVNCFSAKDRTSFVVSRRHMRILADSLGDKGKSFLRKIGRRVFNRVSVSFQIIAKNGFRAMKISPLSLPGLNKSVRAMAKRIRKYVNAFFSVLKS